MTLAEQLAGVLASATADTASALLERGHAEAARVLGGLPEPYRSEVTAILPHLVALGAEAVAAVVRAVVGPHSVAITVAPDQNPPPSVRIL